MASPLLFRGFTDMMHSRTYGKDTGEDIREGYEPPKDVAVDGAQDEESEQFAVGEDEDSEESRQWKQEREPEVLLKPKYGVEGEDFENVWGSGDPSTSPKENP
jgi:hypothetical protein